MKSKVVLSLCDYSGVMLLPWANAGFSCLAVDIVPREAPSHENIKHIQVDIREWLPPRVNYKIGFAFPPCTNLSVSGARWFKDKGLRGLCEGIELVARCHEILEWTDAPWMLENPVSTLSTYWRKPDYKFDPCDYGDPYTKKTCLWTSSDFVMPPKNRVEPTQGSMMHLMPPSEDRGRLRSITPEGFALAVFEANKSRSKK